MLLVSVPRGGDGILVYSTKQSDACNGPAHVGNMALVFGVGNRMLLVHL